MSDWEDEGGETVGYSAPTSYEQPGIGKSTGKGRGFIAHDNDWDDDDTSTFQESHFDTGGRDFGGSDNGNRQGGRGGRGGRGGPRGVRGDRDRDGVSNGQFDDADYQLNGGDARKSGFRGGRGSRDGGRGGGKGGRGNGDGGGDNEKEKPRERYIPPERECSDELFEQGVTAGINFDKYDSIKVMMSGENKPQHIESFQCAGLREFVLNNVLKSGYRKPTPVQKYSIPAIMAGRDLMACAQTGSGKTAAFLLPIINTLLGDPGDIGEGGYECQPQVIIVCPTRELAIQIYDEARKFSMGSILKIGIAYGGASAFHQASRLKTKGCDILVATAGRLKDFVDRGTVSFSSMRYFVLDEADRMLDMGFLPDIEQLLQNPNVVPAGERQTLMFSATFPKQIQQLASKFMHNYLFLTVGVVGAACSDVEQNFIKVSKFQKRQTLTDLLNSDPGDKILVFVEKKRSADFIATFLCEQKFPTTSIHGDRMQREREEALRDFRYGRMRILVATAVANRGLDIKGVSHVVFFDLPKSIEDYVHGIGRTGRVGNRGKATSFYDSENDSHLAGDIINILKQTDQEIPSWLESESSGGGSSFRPSNFGGRDYRKFDDPIALSGNQGQPIAVEEEEDW
ncbi:ATP-dependent RNA helicase vasa [Lycorma delicatula]|uniref:ATP-dependent RNA helicase vasa n=1 Tax=Lycorma delicatula TaxID=130591 RepID=UPI003F511A53